LNIFEDVLHSAYHCLKVPATFGVITIFGSQKEDRNIQRGCTPGHKNVHFLREDTDQPKQPLPKQEISVEFKKAIKAKGHCTRVALDPRELDRTMCIRADISPEEQARLLQFLDKNSDVFAWSTSDLIGVSMEVI
jgi:hypothetical protein